MGRKIQIELQMESSSDEDQIKKHLPTQNMQRQTEAVIKRDLRRVTNRHNPSEHVTEHGQAEPDTPSQSKRRFWKRSKSKERKPAPKDQSLIQYYGSHPDMNRDQRMTLEGKLYRTVGGSGLVRHPRPPLPHSFNRLNEKQKQHVVAVRAQEADTITVEEFSTDLLRRKGVKYWISELLKRIERDPGSLVEIPNIAYEIIRNYTVVVFSTKGSKSGREVSKMLEKAQDKYNLKKDTFLELILDDSKAGARSYNDLVLITQMRGLPQIFIGETFIGGYDALKKLFRFKKLGPMILEALGYTTWPCKLCDKEQKNVGRTDYVQSSREYEEKLLLRSHLYPGHP